jgi:hypothetical protein
MNGNLAILGLTVTLFASAQGATAAEKDNDPLWVAMIGVAGEWDVPGGSFSGGPSLAVEFNVIKDWLEIEMGGAKLFRGSNWEFENEVVFRKPFTLSETTELMVGLGPMWSKAKGENGKVGTTFVADFNVLVVAREEVRLVRRAELFGQSRERTVIRRQLRSTDRFPLGTRSRCPKGLWASSAALTPPLLLASSSSARRRSGVRRGDVISSVSLPHESPTPMPKLQQPNGTAARSRRLHRSSSG